MIYLWKMMFEKLSFLIDIIDINIINIIILPSYIIISVIICYHFYY